MQIPYFHVDAFTGEVFTGNPAGVCLLEEWLDDFRLQNIARENNLSETAFVVAEGTKYALRWFTPTMEVDLCGHATLAAAFVLNLVQPGIAERLNFTTRSGELAVTRQEDMYYLDFPARPAAPCPSPPELIEGLGAEPLEVLKARDFLAIFKHEDQIKSIQPDFARLAELDCLGTIVTSPGKEADFVSRFFAPGAGVPEDPVTGSSHCTLIPYWAGKTGKDRMLARQLSQRGGELLCENRGDRVLIGGKAVLYHSGRLQL